MQRNFWAALVVAGLGLVVSHAQEIVPVTHGGHQHGTPVVVHGPACEGGNCGTCASCVRIPDKQHTKTVYSIKCKEVCVPNCGLFGWLRGGCEADCGNPIHVKQLVKKTVNTDECPGTKCVPAAEAAKYWEAKAKESAPKVLAPVPAPAPSKMPAGAVNLQTTTEPIIIRNE